MSISPLRLLAAFLPLLLLAGCPDADLDGIPDSEDCAPDDPTISPEVPEVCDGIDNDCDGIVDGGLPTFDYHPDVDLDGFGDAEADPTVSCADQLDGHVLDGTDCDDSNADIHPEAVELCNGTDDDCNGEVDDDVQYLDWWPDRDGDEYGDASVEPTNACDAPEPTGWVTVGDDCDDTNADIHPGAVEIPDDGVDQNCDTVDGSECYEDADFDGFGSTAVLVNPNGSCEDPGFSPNSDDCNDADPLVFPGAPDTPDDGIDQDCSTTDTVTCWTDGDGDGYGAEPASLEADGDCVEEGLADNADDCDDADEDEFPGQTWFEDSDEDTFGSSLSTQVACEQPAGWVLDATDCDDTDPNEFPGQTWYEDSDVDTFGNSASSQVACEQPAGWVLDATDCDDTDPDEFPGQTWFLDADGDDYGDPTLPQVACEQPADYVTDDTDCNDGNPAEFPGQTWYADGDSDGYGLTGSSLVQCLEPGGYAVLDGDCDDQDPNEFPGQSWYEDLDNDTYGNPNSALVQCEQPGGYVLDDTDCDDTDGDQMPGQTWFEDIDGDGFGNSGVSLTQCAEPTGYVLDDTDCDDNDLDAYPGADWYEDIDGDGFGNPAVSQTQCLPPAGYVSDDTDCDDFDPDAFPGAQWYIDDDEDGYGELGSAPVVQCAQPLGYEADDTDCDDTNDAIHPLATEVCDGVDDDCNGTPDDGFPDLDVDGTADCVDLDADGDGVDASAGDCDDFDASAFPGNPLGEVCGDGVDNNCDEADNCYEMLDDLGNSFSMTPFSSAAGFVPWYSYGSPAAASSNTGFEVSERIVEMLYLDPSTGKVGVVMMTDLPNDGTGGTASVSLSGFFGAQIAAMDDPGENPLSALNATTGNGTLGFNWIACCNDGFVITDMAPGFCATVDVTATTQAGLTTWDYDPVTGVSTRIDLPGPATQALTFCDDL